jgi:hypothetical protein
MTQQDNAVYQIMICDRTYSVSDDDVQHNIALYQMLTGDQQW